MNFKGNETAQKLRGGYYTPVELTAFISKWISGVAPERILEPSCGDGAFFAGLAEYLNGKATVIKAFELDGLEAVKAQARATEVGIKIDIKAADFLGWAIPQLRAGGPRFDAIVGNPPFIRYQYLPEDFQERAERVFSELNCKFTKHTNAWVSFVLASVALLRPGGRLGMVLPSEIIHVSHAQSLRSYLGAQCRKVVIIDPEQLWFDGTLQGAVILLAEKCAHSKQTTEGVGIVPVVDREFLSRDPEELFIAPRAVNGKTIAGKWTRALLDSKTLALLDDVLQLPNIHRFEDVAEVDVGIVTGANKFFLVDDATVDRYGLHDYAHPMFGRSEHCPGVIYDEAQHRANSATGKPTNFIWFPNATVARDLAIREYIRLGEQQSLHTRFKCRVRRPWYSVPSVYATHIGMLKRSHDTPRLILNRVNAFTTDTAYRVRADAALTDQFVACFMNPLTALSAELEGRHYGGGVLELVPSEIERLCIALPDNDVVDLENLDRLIRQKPASEVLSRNGALVLSAIGLSQDQQDILLESWTRLRNRRQRVRSKSSVPSTRQISLAA